MSKKELAAQYHASGCNCAMAVGCAFCDKAGVSEDEMKALTRRYGGGAHKYCGATPALCSVRAAAASRMRPSLPKRYSRKNKCTVSLSSRTTPA